MPKNKLKTKRKRPEKVVRTLAQVAIAFRVARQTVDAWRLRGMPGRPGAWNLKEIEKWRAGRPRPPEPAPPKDDNPDLEWKRHRAALMRIRLERERGVLVPLDVHEGLILRICSVFRSGLYGLAPTLAMQLEGLDSTARLAMIRERFGELLENVALNASSSAADSEPEPKPTPRQRRKPRGKDPG